MANESRGQQVARTNQTVEMKVALKKDLLPRALPEIKDLLPKNMDPNRFIAMAYLAVAQSEDLQKCSPISIVRSTVQAAVCGLEIGGMLGHGYLVPFKGECTFMPGFRGMIHLMHQGGGIISGQAHNVYDGDDFDVLLGSEPKIYHRPDFSVDRIDDNIRYAYFAGKLSSGEQFFRVLTRDEIEKRRAVSKMKNGVTWTQWFEEMCKKTATRAAAKEVPVAFHRLSAAVELDTRVETGRMENPIPGYEDEDAIRAHVTEQTQAKAIDLGARVAAQAEAIQGREISPPALDEATSRGREPGEDDDYELTPEERQRAVAASAQQHLGGPPR